MLIDPNTGELSLFTDEEEGSIHLDSGIISDNSEENKHVHEKMKR